jgi:hypothetical protein
LIRTGIAAASIASFFAITLTLARAAIQAPDLLLAPFSKPFIFVILSILVLMALGCGVLVGTIGGILGRWSNVTPAVEARRSHLSW